ncbi:4Fe-4S dicluster domain-containing protein [Lentisphaerota bacterium ZTH]|nr:4Fe-4S dicluster domain-containing protein [Lentisphaerota bacterium]WET06236.1 4Fe-4S dicluster domain-containing protein [Lentisphaerota bacterium ZTH]
MNKNKTKKKFKVIIEPDECKGCERCVNACPKSVLKMSSTLNFMGLPYACYTGDGCIGCSACFYNCPEPGAVTIVEITEED